eukprot:Rhum_TRINITY_DN545_c0_g1::Rhum_TRINITY_DN545_c0_g1_i1::g.1560::m.1560
MLQCGRRNVGVAAVIAGRRAGWSLARFNSGPPSRPGHQWEEMLENRASQANIQMGLVEQDKIMRNQTYEQANLDLEAELSKYKGTQEEKIAQLLAARQRGQWLVNLKMQWYWVLYRGKQLLPMYCLFMLIAWAIYSCSFMRSNDKVLQSY